MIPKSITVTFDPVKCLCVGFVLFISLAGVFFATVDHAALSEVKASDWAAWVQAIGSILAIVGAFAVATYQGRAQRKGEEARRAEDRLHVAENLRSLAAAAITTSGYVVGLLDTREKVHEAASGHFSNVSIELDALAVQLAAVPLHAMPAELVRSTRMLAGAIRQMRHRIANTLAKHAQMDATDFEEFFASIRGSRDMLAGTVKTEVEAAIGSFRTHLANSIE